MEVREQQSVGLVLRRYDYGESSQIGHLLTPADGRISVLAKGIKKPNAYLKGPFDLFQLARISWRRRPSSDLGLLTRYEPLTGFPGMRGNLTSLLAAFYLAEVAWEGVREDDPNPQAFDLVTRALGALDEDHQQAVGAVVLATETLLLDAFGFGLEVTSCVRCGRPAPAGTVPVFALDGGHVCGDCPVPRGAATRLSTGACRLLASLKQAGPRHASRIRLSVEQHEGLRRLMRAAFHGVFEKPLKSESFVRNARFGFLQAARGPRLQGVRASGSSRSGR